MFGCLCMYIERQCFCILMSDAKVLYHPNITMKVKTSKRNKRKGLVAWSCGVKSMR